MAVKMLILNGRSLEFDWIAANFRSLDQSRFTFQERVTLSFCGDWLSGADSFEVETSGSTGPPKRICLSRQQMIASAHLTAEALGLRAGHRTLVCLSPAFIAGKMMLVRGLELDLGITVVEPALNPYEQLSEAKAGTFDFAAFVPLQLQAVVAAGDRTRSAFQKLQMVLVGGASVPDSLVRQLGDFPGRIYQSFGMTETASHVALRRLNGAEATEFYTCLPGVQISQDARGCLVVQSSVTAGRRLVTNDTVEILSQRTFKWLGRADWVINSGGVKVHPERVESAILETLSEIQGEGGGYNCFVAGRPDDNLGEKVIALFEGSSSIEDVWPELQRRLLQRLSRFEVPREFYRLPAFEKTSNGKVDRTRTVQTFLMQQTHD